MVTILLSGGSKMRGETAYTRAAFAFGKGVAERGWTLRTGGGGGSSIMGAATDGALEAGGREEGVILRKFLGARHPGIRAMRVCSAFGSRKSGLLRGVQGVAVLPGGYGTLDELGDVLTLKQTGLLDVPVLLVNVGGYFDGIISWARRAGREGFLYGGRLFLEARTPGAAIRGLARHLKSYKS